MSLIWLSICGHVKAEPNHPHTHPPTTPPAHSATDTAKTKTTPQPGSTSAATTPGHNSPPKTPHPPTPGHRSCGANSARYSAHPNQNPEPIGLFRRRITNACHQLATSKHTPRDHTYHSMHTDSPSETDRSQQAHKTAGQSVLAYNQTVTRPLARCGLTGACAGTVCDKYVLTCSACSGHSGVSGCGSLVGQCVGQVDL